MRTEPLEKTLIARMISLYPGDSDEQIVERFLQEQERLGVEEPETWITGEMVARWRPEVTQ
ncbi:MAG TPA: hypothetical protein VFM12_06385 [Gemmatimonadales bacterium]|nr:hypothetical protein [Gemmatimonadales bacterium]